MDWTITAGPYAGSKNVTFQCLDSQPYCQIYLPKYGTNEGHEYRFELWSYNHSLPPKDITARWLEQVTFGTTRSDLNYIRNQTNNFTSSLNDEFFPAYLYEQMYQVPMTSHREYWRKRVDALVDGPIMEGTATHPCLTGARFRRAALNARDDGKKVVFTLVEVEEVASDMDAEMDVAGVETIEEHYTLSIDGYIRTSIPKSQLTWESNASLPILEDGDANAEFFICRVYNGVNSTLGLSTASSGAICRNLSGGNPLIKEDGWTIENKLMVTNVSSHHSIYHAKDRGDLKHLILQSDIEDDRCEEIAIHDSIPTFAQLPGGQLLLHDPRLILQANTLEEPLPDGGGSNVLSTDVTICSNVPRTFLNEASCYYSTVESACRPDEDRPVSGTIKMNSPNIRKLYESTGRYLYVIRDLRVEDDASLSSPCKTGERSRWRIFRNGCVAEGFASATNLNMVTKSSFLTLLDEVDTADSRNFLVKDVYFRDTLSCHADDLDRNIMYLQNRGVCYVRVHPDEFNIYDMTMWTKKHPGNSGDFNPIKAFAEVEEGKMFLVYPDHHPMGRWQVHKNNFPYISRLGDALHFQDMPHYLRSNFASDIFDLFSHGDKDDTSVSVDDDTAITDDSAMIEKTGTIVCGSPGEVANEIDDATLISFDVTQGKDEDTSRPLQLGHQARNVWVAIALTSSDQLRQRMAWALSQILVISPSAFDFSMKVSTEPFLQYYDIFVRNAFGNYRDILREVMFSPMMADMLTYYESKSTEYEWNTLGKIRYPDENAAREFLQLFTIGLVELNDDYTPVLDDNGEELRVYDNSDIMAYARIFTGFTRQNRRGNFEERVDESNSIDPMKIIPSWRDRYPKMGLNGSFIGENYMLCEDMPLRPFLYPGAKYRILDSKSPAMREILQFDSADVDDVKVTELHPSSDLFNALCNGNYTGECTNPSVVELDEKLYCYGNECDLDGVTVLKVGSAYYEYIPDACVHLEFFNNGKRAIMPKSDSTSESVCVDRKSSIASPLCCNAGSEDALYDSCHFTGELTTYWQSRVRCEKVGKKTCNVASIEPSNDVCFYAGYYWSGVDCEVYIVVNPNGEVAVEREDMNTGEYESLTFFRVAWKDNQYPLTTNNSCGPCEKSGIFCRCTIDVYNHQVFFDVPSREDVLSTLRIGGLSRQAFIRDEEFIAHDHGDVVMYTKFDGIDDETIFKIKDDFNRIRFLKNMESTVHIRGPTSSSGVTTEYSFRNPPKFLSTVLPSIREAESEVDAALDQMIHHKNTPAFLSFRLIQRFGISNPSPHFIRRVVAAFTSGTFTVQCNKTMGETDRHLTDDSQTITFGSGTYGDLASTIAAILLDRETRDVAIDSDPTHGSLREPLLKMIALMRNLEYKQSTAFGLALYDLPQMAHMAPDIFSFFLPEYSSPGRVSDGLMVSPESMLLHQSVSMLNGMISLVKFGLSSCNGGFGYRTHNCNLGEVSSAGYLSYQTEDMEDAGAIIDELASLMTSGRMNKESRSIMKSAYDAEHDKTQALILAQQLVLTSPDFHSTGMSQRKDMEDEEIDNTKSCRRYKAVVHILLKGGADSYNMLVPLSDCRSKSGSTKDLFQEYQDVRGSIALDKDSLLSIDATGSSQVCNEFGLHPQLSSIQRLYESKEVAFLANVGVLNEPVTKKNYLSKTKTQLFAHNKMQKEINRVDPFDKTAGTGMLGRLSDALMKQGYRTSAFSIDASLSPLTGLLHNSTTAVVSSENGFVEFDPSSHELLPTIKELNDISTPRSSVFSDTWSSSFRFYHTLGKSNELYWAEKNAVFDSVFPHTDVGKPLEMITRMISSHECRGNDRDIFYFEIPGYDTHRQSNRILKEKLSELNEGLDVFVREMKSMSKWNDVSVVITSDFGRTLTSNSGDGTDHGWAGHNLVLGGDVDGGKILGKYPDDLTDNGDLNIGRGRLLPTMPYDAVWQAVSMWTGVDEEGIDQIIPNRHSFHSSNMLVHEDLFKMGSHVDEPTCSDEGINTSCVPSSSPSLQPSVLPTRSPTSPPSQQPTVSSAPSGMPSISLVPTSRPTSSPSVSTFPTQTPSLSPSVLPTVIPTVAPSVVPSVLPTAFPSTSPSSGPSRTPTLTPSLSPSTSKSPSLSPTYKPTAFDSEQLFYVKNLATKKYLNIRYGPNQCENGNHLNARLWRYDVRDVQKFYFGDNNSIMSVMCEGKALDLQGGKCNNDRELILWDANGRKNQEFNYDRKTGQITTPHCDKLVTHFADAPMDSSAIRLWDEADHLNQTWSIIPIKRLSFHIKNAASGQYLESDNGCNWIQFGNKTEHNSQKFFFDRGQTLMNVGCEKAVSIATSKCDNGVPISLEIPSGNTDQQFIMEADWTLWNPACDKVIDVTDEQNLVLNKRTFLSSQNWTVEFPPSEFDESFLIHNLS